MLKVFKYEVPIDDCFSLDLPEEATVLHVEVQHEIPQLWALINPNTSIKTTRRFRLAGTGHEITERADKLQHIGSLLMRGGGVVWHVFEVLE